MLIEISMAWAGPLAIECVRLPGWTVLGVAAILGAPRLLERYLDAQT